jgi:glucose/mannose-6-phosphate isomerase
MKNLNDIKKILKLDAQGVAGSIESLGLQCQQAWDEVKKIKIPRSYRNVSSVVINGMGGSALGGHVIETLYKEKLKVPLKVTNSYSVPGFVNNKTLFVLSSYSGTTEEVLATLPMARKRKAKMLIICAGGKLARAAKQYRIPAYIFEPRFNPSNQPRMGLGYSIFGQMALLSKCGLLKVTEREYKEVVKKIILLHGLYGLKVPIRNNMAKKTALGLYNKIPIIVAAEHLSGNAHIMANQINENSKTFSAYFLVSELNHHLMEGMRFPDSNKRNLCFVMLESKKYLPRIQKRFLITKKVLTKNKISFIVHPVKSITKISQVFETLLFGSYVNYYMAILNGINPAPVPYVDFFKKELS